MKKTWRWFATRRGRSFIGLTYLFGMGLFFGHAITDLWTLPDGWMLSVIFGVIGIVFGLDCAYKWSDLR